GKGAPQVTGRDAAGVEGDAAEPDGLQRGGGAECAGELGGVGPGGKARAGRLSGLIGLIGQGGHVGAHHSFSSSRPGVPVGAMPWFWRVKGISSETASPAARVQEMDEPGQTTNAPTTSAGSSAGAKPVKEAWEVPPGTCAGRELPAVW